MENKKPVAVVVGAGPGNGAALARRFVEAGYTAAILSRHRSTLTPIENELAETRGFECDVAGCGGFLGLNCRGLNLRA
jgi:NAD(P)-dependent dehydrogenase (short-subunit alcohol dehydrogenase family)